MTIQVNIHEAKTHLSELLHLNVFAQLRRKIITEPARLITPEGRVIELTPDT